MAQPASGRPRSLLASGLQLALLLLIAVAMLVPLFWLVSTSLKGPAENIFTSPPALLPSQPSLEAYQRLFADNPMLGYIRNSAWPGTLAYYKYGLPFIDGANKLYSWEERVDMSYWITANGQPANR